MSVRLDLSAERERDAGALATDDGAAALQQSCVEPHPVALGNPLPDPNPAKAAGLVHGDTGVVVGKDRGLESPNPGSLRLGDEGQEESLAEALPAHSGGQVDAHFGDAVVDLAPRDRAKRGPADHLFLQLSHQTAVRTMGLIPSLPGRRLGLEGGQAGCQPFFEDSPHYRPVALLQGGDG